MISFQISVDYLPEGYCKKLKYEEGASVFVKYIGDNMHSDYLHDYIESWGMFDVTITVGPIPDEVMKCVSVIGLTQTIEGLRNFTLTNNLVAFPSTCA